MYKVAVLLLCALTCPSQCSRSATEASVASEDDNGCEDEYKEDLLFDVGDKVQFLDGAAPKAINFVGCPEDDGKVCIVDSADNALGCFPPDKLHRLSKMDQAFIVIDGQSRRLATAAKDKGSAGAAAATASVAAYARTTLDKSADWAAFALAKVNICDPAVQQTVRDAAIAIKHSIVFVANTAVEYWPTVEEKLVKPMLDKTWYGIKVSTTALKRSLKKGFNKGYKELEVDQKIKDLNAQLRTIWLETKKRHGKVETVIESVDAFSKKVVMISSMIAEKSVDVYESEKVQAALASLNAQAGKLIAAAAAKSPDVKGAMAKMAEAAGQQIKDLSDQAFEAVNLCSPEVQQKIRDAFVVVQRRAGELGSAVAKHLPVVQEFLSDLAENMASALALLKEKVANGIQNVKERQSVQDAIAIIERKTAELKDKLSNRPASARELAEGIQKAVSSLAKRVSDYEAPDVENVDVDQFMDLLSMA